MTKAQIQKEIVQMMREIAELSETLKKDKNAVMYSTGLKKVTPSEAQTFFDGQIQALHFALRLFKRKSK